MTDTTTAAGKMTRAQRMAMPLATDVVKDLAIENGACIRPVQLRRTDQQTGETETVLVPCGHTLASVCPPCAERAKTLRTAQCRKGWHLEDEPDIQPDPATQDQRWLVTQRAEAQQARDLIAATGDDTADLDALITELDEDITTSGVRGKAAPARPKRRHRSTRRRQDAPDLPKRKVSVSATDPARYSWELVAPGDPDHLDHDRRVLQIVADRLRWQAALAEARRRAALYDGEDLPATGEVAA